MIVFAHTKFGLVRIQGSGVKRGAESAPPVCASFSNPGPDRVKLLVTFRREISVSFSYHFFRNR